MIDCERTARELFGRYGLTPGKFINCNVHQKFGMGGECHAPIFADAYVHFHVGMADGWQDAIPGNAPVLRIRSMEFNGGPVGESDWFPA